MGRRCPHRAWREAQRARTRPPPARKDTIDLIRRLAEHHPDDQIAAILNRQGRKTGQGCRSRAHASKPPGSGLASQPPRHQTPTRTSSRSSKPPPSLASPHSRSVAG